MTGKLLRIMHARRSLVGFGILAVGVGACERAKPAARVESTAAANAPAAERAATASAHAWDPSAGRVLLVEGESPGQALVIPPDSATAVSVLTTLPKPAAATLLGRGGTVQAAELDAAGDTETCRPWPVVAAPPPRPWSVGFVGGVVSPIALDSLDGFSRADSTTLVATVIRLASALPNDSAGRFAGLPFSVHSLWRFRLTGNLQVLAATLVRQINQEATPLQERTLLVAQRMLSGSDSTYATAYSERSYGDEESIETSDILAAAELGSNRRATLILARDFGDAVSFGFIERDAEGRWRSRWTSARRRC